MQAKILRSAKREFLLLLETGQEVQAIALGKLLKQDDLVVGDEVVVAQDQTTGEYSIVECLPRRSEIFRLLVRESKRKVTAANIDKIVIVVSVANPEYKRGIVDRFLIRAAQWDLPALLIFNKLDVVQEGLDLKFEEERLKNLGVKCFELSAKNHHYQPRFLQRGYAELQSELRGQCAIFLGQSGVGKSSTINLLTEGEFDLKTKEIGVKSGKGTHSTTWSELIEFKNFSLIDSPGVRTLALDDIESEHLIDYFPDLAPLFSHCQFSNCKHEERSKGCFFYSKDFVESGDALLVQSRLESFVRIINELEENTPWDNKYSN